MTFKTEDMTVDEVMMKLSDIDKKEQATRPRVIEIAGRRWFSATYGNTYFTCTILIDGHQVHQTDDYQYGYGDFYIQWAVEWLKENGYLTGIDGTGSGTLSMYCRENDIVLSCHANDVSRRRDL